MVEGPALASAPELTEGSAVKCVDEELATKAAAQKRLNRGRLLTLVGVIVLSFDTPTFRYVRTQSPASNALGQGLAATVWRGFCYCIASFVVLCLESSSLTAFREAVTALGWRKLLFCAADLGASALVADLLRLAGTPPRLRAAAVCLSLFNPLTVAVSTRGSRRHG